MTYASPSLASRIGALTASTAIHVALGLALLVNLNAGSPDASSRAGKHGDLVLIDLQPLPDGGTPDRGEGVEDKSRSEDRLTLEEPGKASINAQSGTAEQLGAPPPGDGGDADSDGRTGMEAPKDGAPAMSGAEVQAFRSRLLSHIERFRRYPPDARAAGEEGIVRIQFVMDGSGNVLEAWVDLSSGSAALDEEAIAAVLRAQPLPSPPAHWPQPFGVSLPIGYSLR